MTDLTGEKVTDKTRHPAIRKTLLAAFRAGQDSASERRAAGMR